uniref:ATP-binding cassette domain-containing protein n=1 Tax=Marinobacter sp. TaxID=50741 RepID=UPI0035C73542
VPENGYRLSGIASYGSAANERSVAGATDVAVGKQFVVHADGSYLKTDDLKIGGYVLSRRARAEALLGRLGLGSEAGRRVETFSGGERQRIAVARALVEAREQGRRLDLVALDGAGRTVGRLTYKGLLTAGSTYEALQGRQRMVALYAADEWQFAERWRLDWGLRHERA